VANQRKKRGKLTLRVVPFTAGVDISGQRETALSFFKRFCRLSWKDVQGQRKKSSTVKKGRFDSQLRGRKEGSRKKKRMRKKRGLAQERRFNREKRPERINPALQGRLNAQTETLELSRASA